MNISNCESFSHFVILLSIPAEPEDPRFPEYIVYPFEGQHESSALPIKAVVGDGRRWCLTTASTRLGIEKLKHGLRGVFLKTRQHARRVVAFESALHYFLTFDDGVWECILVGSLPSGDDHPYPTFLFRFPHEQ